MKRYGATGLGIVVLSSLLVACGSEDSSGRQAVGGGNGSGGSGANSAGGTASGSGGDIAFGGGFNATGGTSGGDCSPTIVGLLRDFSDTHPNFELTPYRAEEGIVAAQIGEDRKPVFEATTERMYQTVTTAEDFNQWYNDTPDVNMTFEHTLDFDVDPDTGRAVYENTAFFPLDDRGFGNEGREHNYHFTFELHMEFRYTGGEVFTFSGDDDVFVFINDHLAIDLGGIHASLSETLDLDAAADALGIEPGNTYPLDFFHAERRVVESNFRVESTLRFTNCEPILIR